jgi:hypothetical protein
VGCRQSRRPIADIASYWPPQLFHMEQETSARLLFRLAVECFTGGVASVAFGRHVDDKWAHTCECERRPPPPPPTGAGDARWALFLKSCPGSRDLMRLNPAPASVIYSTHQRHLLHRFLLSLNHVRRRRPRCCRHRAAPDRCLCKGARARPTEPLVRWLARARQSLWQREMSGQISRRESSCDGDDLPTAALQERRRKQRHILNNHD